MIDYLFLIKQGISFLLRLVPMALKWINDKLFPIKLDQLIVDVKVVELNESINHLYFLINIQNITYSDLDMKNLSLDISPTSELSIFYNYPILRVIKIRETIQLEFYVSLTDKQIALLKEIAKVNKTSMIGLVFVAKARKCYFKFNSDKEFTLKNRR